MNIQLAKRLPSLTDRRLAMLDCGKRGGLALLDAVANRLREESGSLLVHESKTSAHRMASRTLVERLSDECDAIVYGVVN